MTPAPIACTIVANNYLAYARVFARSVRERMPDARVVVLIVDRPDPSVHYADEPFEAIFVNELGIEDFDHVAFRYSLLELSTAVKPSFLLHLHRRCGAAAVCYFDPDILVTGDLTDLYVQLTDYDLLLTPHVTGPIEDDRQPGERDFLRSGIYNLGFLGVAFNARTMAFLEWWRRRLRHDCLHAVDRGLFVDQKWMDFAPAFLPGVRVLREPQWNMAYWNLAQRHVESGPNGWTIDGKPLGFFHFSGAVPDELNVISRFQNRFSLADRPDVAPLFLHYHKLLREAGHENVRQLTYHFGTFENGIAVPHIARQALRTADRDARRWANPFATDGRDSFFAWLTEPHLRDGLPMPRFALALWDERRDLQHAFADPEGVHRPAFLEWIVGHHGECALPAPFWEPLAVALARLRDDPAASADVIRWRAVTTLARGGLAADALSAEEIAALNAEIDPGQGGGIAITHLALLVQRRRADLRSAFSKPLDRGRLEFAYWFVTDGRREYAWPASLLRPVLRSLPVQTRLSAAWWWLRNRGRVNSSLARGLRSELLVEMRPAAGARSHADGTAPRGVNVVGWKKSATGVGEICRSTLAALAGAEVPHARWALGEHADGPATGQTAHDGQPYGVTLFHVNADGVELVTRQMPRALVSTRYRIGYWFWELSHFPLALSNAFDSVDEVWAPSRFCFESYSALARTPVRLVPPAVVPPDAASLDRRTLGIAAAPFLFYFAFDVLSVPERKNPAGLLRAFAEAVRRSRRPLHLLLKVTHLDREPALRDEIERQSRGLPVTLLAETLERRDVDALMATCDAFVSLHRSEGLGLSLIEAMYLRKPVIATGYGGVTDFVDDGTARVVRHRLAPLARPYGPYPEGAVWADPDLDHAAQLMVELAECPASHEARLHSAHAKVSALYHPRVAGERMRRELDRIFERLGLARSVRRQSRSRSVEAIPSGF